MNRADLRHCLAAGYAAMTAWSDLLDRINVFPVADGDTGANLRASLALFADPATPLDSSQLAAMAVGNSGNIAAAFFQPLLDTHLPLAGAAHDGARQANQAVSEPAPGTMLDLFTSLAETLQQDACEEDILTELRKTVLRGPRLLPCLAEARVVDAGALAMYIFFAGFLQAQAGRNAIRVKVMEPFAGWLEPHVGEKSVQEKTFCLDFSLRTAKQEQARQTLAGMGESLVVAPDRDLLKVHVHTKEPEQIRTRLQHLGELSGWRTEPIVRTSSGTQTSRIRIITDAAGSLPPDLAREHGISLLESMILCDGQSMPEGCWQPDQLYHLMRQGKRASTAQCPERIREQRLNALVAQYEHCLYLSVGSAYTGNYQAALRWREQHNADHCLQVIDTGAASGRLALIALLTGRMNQDHITPDTLTRQAQHLCSQCRELLFIEELQYLVRGGRISRAKGFFADLLGKKPVISPEADGARRVAVVRNSAQQMDLLREHLGPERPRVILVQYTDNRPWLETKILPLLEETTPEAEILVVPLSLTSGVHLGPGAWGVAWIPELGIRKVEDGKHCNA